MSEKRKKRKKREREKEEQGSPGSEAPLKGVSRSFEGHWKGFRVTKVLPFLLLLRFYSFLPRRLLIAFEMNTIGGNLFPLLIVTCTGRYMSLSEPLCSVFSAVCHNVGSSVCCAFCYMSLCRSSECCYMLLCRFSCLLCFLLCVTVSDLLCSVLSAI